MRSQWRYAVRTPVKNSGYTFHRITPGGEHLTGKVTDSFRTFTLDVIWRDRVRCSETKAKSVSSQTNAKALTVLAEALNGMVKPCRKFGLKAKNNAVVFLQLKWSYWYLPAVTWFHFWTCETLRSLLSYAENLQINLIVKEIMCHVTRPGLWVSGQG